MDATVTDSERLVGPQRPGCRWQVVRACRLLRRTIAVKPVPPSCSSKCGLFRTPGQLLSVPGSIGPSLGGECTATRILVGKTGTVVVSLAPAARRRRGGLHAWPRQTPRRTRALFVSGENRNLSKPRTSPGERHPLPTGAARKAAAPYRQPPLPILPPRHRTNGAAPLLQSPAPCQKEGKRAR